MENVRIEEPIDHLPKMGEYLDYFTDREYVHKSRFDLDDSVVFSVKPAGQNRRGTKFKITCIVCTRFDDGFEVQHDASCVVTVRDGIIINVSEVVDYWYDEHYQY